MDGILNVLKPPEMTSFDVVAHLRGLLGTKKIGHAGTLDPLAVGVLPVCIGRATRAIEFLMDKDKYYRAELTIGIITDTQDSSGKVLASKTPECTDQEIKDAICSFEGKYLQVPPMYSALKVDGKRLYELARNGIEIERQHREVEVYSIKVLDIDRIDGIKVLFDVHCSKGTYIRTLCADIGEVLSCGGHMSFLLRKRAGPFDISTAYALEELAQRKKDGTLQSALLEVDVVFKSMPCYTLDEKSDKKFRNGMQISIPDDSEDSSLIRVYSTSGEFIALGTVRKGEGESILKVKKFF